MNNLAKAICFLLFLFQPVSLTACEDSILNIKYNDKSVKIQIELADTYLKRKNGLMFRQNLASDSGMLFTYDFPQKVGFWMKNTSIPLDIAFADKEGMVLKVVHDTKPFSLDVIDGGENIQYVLEINAGMSERLNLFQGAELVHRIMKKNVTKPCSG